ncbi:DUF5412 family protein [Lederbergia citrea]|uniref:Uncharacterized protein n=1 Tax=Lederbergia citrea TaxID=2833581 RepID=A0A942USC7_9BACI|nr:DUF5412 family protein [Lederbergia citrea]MBS4178867.1 hypothetical protein [Lederbergia citrea]MBS4205547.1 hypothetical protein [Lederbergia citrea]MBS4224118.1 hypothetical protein [Lederbergia citrea]
MKKWKKWILIISIIIGFSGIMLMGCKIVLEKVFAGMCANEIVKKVDSPNGKKTAYIFKRDCGATTAESFQLSILNNGGDLKNKSGNTFVSSEEFSVEWLNDSKLQIKYDQTSETFKMDSRVKRINVEYVGK